MPSHTLRLGGRDERRIRLTEDEAMALYDKGFRFSIFRPQEGEYQLSLPFQVAEDRVHETLTVMQEERG
jgi:hypothetical protein